MLNNFFGLEFSFSCMGHPRTCKQTELSSQRALAVRYALNRVYARNSIGYSNTQALRLCALRARMTLAMRRGCH